MRKIFAGLFSCEFLILHGRCANLSIAKTYLVRRFPRAFGFLVVLASLNPVVLCCNSWLALVLGRRGEGFPAPGRTGVPARAFWLDALRMKIPMQQHKLALKAHISMASPNHSGHLRLKSEEFTLIQKLAGQLYGVVHGVSSTE